MRFKLWHWLIGVAATEFMGVYFAAYLMVDPEARMSADAISFRWFISLFGILFTTGFMFFFDIVERDRQRKEKKLTDYRRQVYEANLYQI
jgi:hypothetical protein